MTNGPTIRPAMLTDADAVSALTRRAYEPWIALTGRAPLPMQVDYDAAIKVHDFALMELGGDLIGLIETTPENAGLLIVNVAVEPNSQGRGLGRQLLSYAEDRARKLGLPRTCLYTNKMFAKNLSLYKSIGYNVDREEALNGGIAVYMSKQLA